MSIHYFGIRHHGFGSARHLLAELEALRPDCLLLEAPPEGEGLLALVADPATRPPVALLAYQPDQPARAVYYPLTEFSPEWQAIKFAQAHGIPCQFFDLPLAQSFALDAAEEEALVAKIRAPEGSAVPGAEAEEKPEVAAEEHPEAAAEEHPGAETEEHPEAEAEENPEADFNGDPFDRLAELAGHRDGEAWWEAQVERSQNCAEIFSAVHEAVAALRAAYPQHSRPRDLLREAQMRQRVRAAAKQYENIAVVCGAWHVPALQEPHSARDDAALLKGLAKVKVECTLIPWTNRRLTLASGYGAGINAPNWYNHLWQHPDDDGVLWLSAAAKLLRAQKFDVAAAHIIETLRLSRALASLRNEPRPGLDDYLAAINTVISMGDDSALQQIADALLVGDVIGTVPPATPQLPLIGDVEKQRKSLRLPLEAGDKTLTLDLRKPLDLGRSVFIHRLRLLDIHWAEPGLGSSGAGTFKEIWATHYDPEQQIQLLEKAVYGNTLAAAATAFVRSKLERAEHLAELATLLDAVMPADLPPLVEALAEALENLSAGQSDVHDLLATLPPLAGVLRYGSVRQQNTAALETLLLTLLTRLAVGGVQGCIAIDPEAAALLATNIRAADGPLNVLGDSLPEALQLWLQFIASLRGHGAVNPLLQGLATRLLFDRQRLDDEATAEALYQFLSRANHPGDSASWLEGFLHQSGTVLIIHPTLLPMIHDWLATLDEASFTELLPLLRRTFGSFENAERRRIGERASQLDAEGVAVRPGATAAPAALDEAPAAAARETILTLLGVRP